MNPLSKKIEAFGLDFSNQSIKLARLQKQGGRLNLSCFGRLELPAGLIAEGRVLDEKKLAEQLKDFLNHLLTGSLNTNYVVCSLPEEKSFADIFAMPIMQDKELKEAVLLELENHIPVSASEVYCDFQKREVLANAKQQEVFIAATPKDIVEGYLRVLGLAGLIPVALEIESLAVARALIEQAPGALATLIIDLGRHRSSSMIFALGGLRFTSDLAFSGRQLTEVLQEKMKITAQAAEELKIKEGLEGEENIFQAMAPLARSLVAQIKNHLEYFYSQRTASEGLAGEKTKVERILLAGEAASLKGLVNLLSQNIGLNVELGNPWVNILKRPLKAVPLLPYEESLSYAAALGLALRGVPQLTNRLLF